MTLWIVCLVVFSLSACASENTPATSQPENQASAQTTERSPAQPSGNPGSGQITKESPVQPSEESPAQPSDESTAQKSDNPAPGQTADGSSSQQPGTSPSAPSGKINRIPRGFAKEDLIIPLSQMKILESYDAESLLKMLQDAYAEFMEDEDSRKFFTILEETETSYSRDITFEMPNGVTLRVSISVDENYLTKEVTYLINSVTASSHTELFIVWPGAAIYAPVRAFVCDTKEEAQALTTLLVECKMNDPAIEDKFLPLQYRNGTFSIHNQISRNDPRRPELDRLPPFRINFTRYSGLVDTIVDWQRVLKPEKQEIDLNALGFDHVLTHRIDYTGAMVTVTGTATKNEFDNDISLKIELPDLPFRQVYVQFWDSMGNTEDAKTVNDGDTVTVTGTMNYGTYAIVETYINGVQYEDYIYEIQLVGETCKKIS